VAISGCHHDQRRDRSPGRTNPGYDQDWILGTGCSNHQLIGMIVAQTQIGEALHQETTEKRNNRKGVQFS